jgi:type III pantothenate kinase
MGGGISPGMNMRFRALHQHTARLPLIAANFTISDEIPLIGNDTPSNIRSGVIHGMACEIEGILQAYRERYEGLNILLTGGNSGYFAGRLKSKIFADSNLLFKGLYALSGINFSR